jgi:hypothetical protein
MRGKETLESVDLSTLDNKHSLFLGVDKINGVFELDVLGTFRLGLVDWNLALLTEHRADPTIEDDVASRQLSLGRLPVEGTVNPGITYFEFIRLKDLPSISRQFVEIPKVLTLQKIPEDLWKTEVFEVGEMLVAPSAVEHSIVDINSMSQLAPLFHDIQSDAA